LARFGKPTACFNDSIINKVIKTPTGFPSVIRGTPYSFQFLLERLALWNSESYVCGRKRGRHHREEDETNK
jgi:hypothetical protein